MEQISSCQVCSSSAHEQVILELGS
jgi:hypothetical protein